MLGKLNEVTGGAGRVWRLYGVTAEESVTHWGGALSTDERDLGG